jgi:hypothetical protein
MTCPVDGTLCGVGCGCYDLDRLHQQVAYFAGIAGRLAERVEAGMRLHYVRHGDRICFGCRHRWPCPTWLALNPNQGETL